MNIFAVKNKSDRVFITLITHKIRILKVNKFVNFYLFRCPTRRSDNPNELRFFCVVNYSTWLLNGFQ
jgi:hypothetical protein